MGDTCGPVDPTYGFPSLSSTDSLAREGIDREQVYVPGSSAISQPSFATAAVDDTVGLKTEGYSTHPTGSTTEPANPLVTGLGGLPLPNRTSQPSGVCSTPNSSSLVDLEVPACKRLASRAFSPHELISLIGAAFTRKDELEVIGGLGRNTAQTFIDVVHEVRFTVLLFCGAA